MNRFWAFLLPALTSGFATVLLLPLSVHAADLPLFSQGWSLVPAACRDCACGFAGVLATIQNAMNAMISLGVVIMTLIVAYAGITFMTASTNPEAKSKAKNMMINAVVGMLIVLSAWLVVDFIMKALYSGADGQQGKFGPWNSILTGGDTCITSKTLSPLFSGSITAAIPTAGPSAGSTSGNGGGGTCSPPANQNNACSVTNMQGTCFGSRASDASAVCMVESGGGQVAIESGSDRLVNEPGRPSYSIGLWQINLTTTKVAGLNCPAAFTNRCEQGHYIDATNHPGWCDVRIKDPRLYASCVAAAKVPANNIAAACGLYNQSGANGGLQPWWYTTTHVCHFSVH